MSRGAQRGFAVAVLAFLVVLAIAAKLLSPPETPEAGSVESTEPSGRRALLLLLRESGFDAEPWRQAPARLPREDALLWLSKAPSKHGPISADEGGDSKPTSESEKDTSGTPRPDEAPRISPTTAGAFDRSHYRTFLEGGGTIVLPAEDATRRFLVDALGIPKSSIPEAADAGPKQVWAFRDETGERMDVDVRSGGRLRQPGWDSPARSIAWRDDDASEVLAVKIPAGHGRVVLLGDDAFLQNAHIGEHDHALFAAHLAAAFAPGKRVLFDEYALGAWQPGSPATILASPKLFLASLHALLLLGLVVLRVAWVREFARDPASQATTSPLLRARSLAGLLVRAGRFDVLSRFLLEGAARGVERRSPELARDLAARAQAPARDAAELERMAADVRAVERASG